MSVSDTPLSSAERDLVRKLEEELSVRDASQGDLTRARHVSFERTSGDFWGFPWGELVWVYYKPSYVVVFHFSRTTVVVKGRNLSPLYESAMRQDIEVVRPDGRERWELDQEGMVIHTVNINTKKGATDGLEEFDIEPPRE